MPIAPSRPGPLARTLAAIGGTLLRAVLALAGLVFVASALVAALIASVGVALWALLSGRRSAMFDLVRRSWRLRRTLRERGRSNGRGDVIDVDAREVGDSGEGPAGREARRIEPPRD